jgi:hypothetical protein
MAIKLEHEGHESLFLILPPPIRVQVWNLCIIEVNREDLGKLLYVKWPNGNNEALQETASVVSVRLLDFHQNTLIRFVQRLRQFFQGMPNTWWKTVPENLQLTGNPSEPVNNFRRVLRAQGNPLTCHRLVQRAS